MTEAEYAEETYAAYSASCRRCSTICTALSAYATEAGSCCGRPVKVVVCGAAVIYGVGISLRKG
jgi:hypothetical protein